MELSRDSILLDNIKEALNLYQRGLVWAVTAALSGALIAIRLHDSSIHDVPVLSGTLSPPAAWAIAQVLYLVFGLLAVAALRSYQRSLMALDPAPEILHAISLFPSLATLPGSFFRLGSVLIAPAATLVSWGVELHREHQGFAIWPEMGWWSLAFLTLLLLVSPFADILFTLRQLRLRASHLAASN